MSEYRTEEQKKRFYASNVWRGKNGLKNQALRRDNFECRMCADEGFVNLDSVKVEGERKKIKLNVHHVKEIETHPELATTLNNLKTICVRHHNLLHNRYQPRDHSWQEERW